jgi:hypothetical protein
MNLYLLKLTHEGHSHFLARTLPGHPQVHSTIYLTGVGPFIVDHVSFFDDVQYVMLDILPVHDNFTPSGWYSGGHTAMAAIGPRRHGRRP